MKFAFQSFIRTAATAMLLVAGSNAFSYEAANPRLEPALSARYLLCAESANDLPSTPLILWRSSQTPPIGVDALYSSRGANGAPDFEEVNGSLVKRGRRIDRDYYLTITKDLRYIEVASGRVTQGRCIDAGATAAAIIAVLDELPSRETELQETIHDVQHQLALALGRSFELENTVDELHAAIDAIISGNAPRSATQLFIRRQLRQCYEPTASEYDAVVRADITLRQDGVVEGVRVDFVEGTTKNVDRTRERLSKAIIECGKEGFFLGFTPRQTIVLVVEVVAQDFR